MKQLNVWLSDELAAEVEASAKADDRSVSSWLRRLIMAQLDREKKNRARRGA